MRRARRSCWTVPRRTSRCALRCATLVEECDILIAGSGFGPALTGLSDLWEVGEAIIEMGPRVVVQTEGKDGAYTVTPDERFHTPSFDVEVLDTTGAGDVFHGAYIVGQLQGWDVRQTAQFATAVSALKLRKLGGRAGIPTFAETLEFLAARGIELPERSVHLTTNFTNSQHQVATRRNTIHRDAHPCPLRSVAEISHEKRICSCHWYQSSSS